MTLSRRRGGICEVIPPKIAQGNRNVLRREHAENVKQSTFQEYRIIISMVLSILVILVTSALLGKSRSIAYVLVSFLWYFASLVVSVYPFLSVYRDTFPEEVDCEIDNHDNEHSEDDCNVLACDLKPEGFWERMVSCQSHIRKLVRGIVVALSALEVSLWVIADGDTTWLEEAWWRSIIKVGFGIIYLLLLPLLLGFRTLRVERRRKLRLYNIWKSNQELNSVETSDTPSMSHGNSNSPPKSPASPLEHIPLQFLSLGMSRSKLHSSWHSSHDPSHHHSQDQDSLFTVDMVAEKQHTKKEEQATINTTSNTTTTEDGEGVEDELPNLQTMQKIGDVLSSMLIEEAQSFENIRRLERENRSRNTQRTSRMKTQPPLRTTRPFVPMMALAAAFCTAYLAIIGWQGRLGAITLSIGLSLLLVALLATFALERTQTSWIFFDVYYVWFYSTVLTRLPLALGPFLVYIVRQTTEDTWWNTILLPCSVTIILLNYILILQWISSRMSASLVYARFLFVGQIFKYVFMNIIFGITDFGVRFFLLLILSNGATVIEHGEVGVKLRNFIQHRLSQIFGVDANDENFHHDDSASSAPPPPALSHTSACRVPSHISSPQTLASTLDPQRISESPETLNSIASHASSTPKTVDVDWKFPDRSSASQLSYDYYHTLMLGIIYEIRSSSQDLLADSIALVTTPTLVWFFLTYGSEATNLEFHFSAENLWLRYGLAIAFRWCNWAFIRKLLSRRTAKVQDQLLFWSVFGTYNVDVDEVSRHVNRFTIRLGMDAKLQRYIPRAMASYLQKRCVSITDVELFTNRYIQDLDLNNLDFSLRSLSVEYYNISNLRRCAKYFVFMSILVIFSVLNAFEQRNQWCFFPNHMGITA
jgi:hypothetical protein